MKVATVSPPATLQERQQARPGRVVSPYIRVDECAVSSSRGISPVSTLSTIFVRKSFRAVVLARRLESSSFTII